MFILSVNYTKPLEEVEKLLDGHREYLNRNFNAGNFVFCGRKVPRTGGIILCRLEDRETVDRIIAEDPFVTGLVAEYELIEFVPTGCADEFEKFI